MKHFCPVPLLVILVLVAGARSFGDTVLNNFVTQLLRIENGTIGTRDRGRQRIEGRRIPGCQRVCSQIQSCSRVAKRQDIGK